MREYSHLTRALRQVKMIPEPQDFSDAKDGAKAGAAGDDGDDDDDGSVASSVAAPSTIKSVQKSEVEPK
jgi:hypothetical protein